MSLRNSMSNPTETTEAIDVSQGTAKQPRVSKADIAPESRARKSDVSEKEVQSAKTQVDGIASSVKDGTVLSEVQSSLHTISTGVEELASTVHDILGLSDPDSSAYSDYDHDTKGQAKLSWAKLKARARRRRRHRQQLQKASAASKAKEAIDDPESDDEGSNKPQEIIPEVRECTFEQFQSRPAGDGHKLHCLDLLVTGDSLNKDKQELEETIEKLKSGKIESWKPSHISDRKEDSTSEDTEQKWIRCIRINSRAVSEMLRIFDPASKSKKFNTRPIVVQRPFQILVSLHKEIKEDIAKVKELAHGGSNGGTSSTDSTKPADSSAAKTTEKDKLMQKLSKNKHALDELDCFVDFMETRIMPDARRWRDPSSPPPEKIRYEDLWYLFKPGDLVYVPRDTSSRDPRRSSAVAKRIMRVIQTNLTTSSLNEPPILTSYNKPWSFLLHFIDHDGVAYGALYQIHDLIAAYPGEKKVTELPIYPISYLEDDQIVAQAKSDGETYVDLIERRSGYYSGWTQTEDPFGVPIYETASGERRASPEHIESDILVDFQETFNAIPSWKLFFYPTITGKERFRTDTVGLDKYHLPLLEWDEAGGVKYDSFDQVLSIDATEYHEAAEFLKKDEVGLFKKEPGKVPTGELLALLPRRFFAYVVLERRFAQLDTRFVRSADLEANDKAFEKLEINRNYKRLILSLVKSHFDKIETEKRTNVEIETQDLIRGKGKGVVILLHGVPGVGKTATAEAVALKWKKPLFPITCGDLGYTAESLEKSLNEIFRLAHHWGCILLLDEADVFITQRERHDLKRNALVSAFLRVLEYYNGIMFLTTNRAGVLDEAVKSRVHLNLFYDHLDENQTVAIFKQHIQRLRDIEKQRSQDENEQIMVLHKEIIQFAKDHFNHRGNTRGSGSNSGRWNGRQIRNAFLIASSLAHYDDEDDGDDEDEDDLAESGRKKQKQLGRSQFELVAQTTLMYDQYRESVHSGKSDDHVAFEREERAISSRPRPSTPDRMK